MRYLFITIMLSMSCTAAFADGELKEIKSATANRWYVGPVFGTTAVRGDYASIAGLQGAWMFNQKYYLGLSFYGLRDPIKNTDEGMGYTGPFAGIMFGSERRVQYSLDLNVGTGKLPYYYAADPSPEEFTFIRPGVNLHIVLNPISALIVNFSYRFVSNSNHASLSNTDLSGPAVSMALVFGRL